MKNLISFLAICVFNSTLFAADRPYDIPYLDLNDQSYRQVVIDHEKGQYLGHPTTCGWMVLSKSRVAGVGRGMG